MAVGAFWAFDFKVCSCLDCLMYCQNNDWWLFPLKGSGSDSFAANPFLQTPRTGSKLRKYWRAKSDWAACQNSWCRMPSRIIQWSVLILLWESLFCYLSKILSDDDLALCCTTHTVPVMYIYFCFFDFLVPAQCPETRVLCCVTWGFFRLELSSELNGLYFGAEPLSWRDVV